MIGRTTLIGFLAALPIVLLSTVAKGQVNSLEGSADETGQPRQHANAPRVIARFIPDSIAIGDRFMLEVEVEQDIMQATDFPVFSDDTFGQIAEIVREDDPDTLSREGRKITILKRYLLQTFEDGYFGFGRFPVLYADKNIIDTLWSQDSLRLKVGSFPIDTLKRTIYDIKPPLDMPLRFGEISGYLAITVLLLALLTAVLWYFFIRRSNLTLLGRPKPVEPAHVKAIKALEELHHQKLWQKGKHKLYYTRLTDILREYLEGRYGIGAMEMTTVEIGNSVQDLVEETQREKLRELLETSDLVKFAKYVPEADANEEFYTMAFYFVEETKLMEEQFIDGQEKKNE